MRETFNRPWASLTFQLFAIIILPLTVLLLVITFGSISLHQSAMRTLVGERDVRSARAAAAAIGDGLDYRLMAISSLSNGLTPDEDIPPLDTSESLLTVFDAGVAVFSRDGSLLFSRGNADLWKSLPGPVLAQLTAAEQGGRASHLQVFIHPSLGSPLALAFAPSPDGRWVAAGAFYTENLAGHVLSDGLEPDHATAILIDPTGQVLYSTGSLQPAGLFGSHPGVVEALRGESGTIYMDEGEIEHVVAYSPVSPGGWALILIEPWEMVTTPLLLTTQFGPLVLVPVLLLALLALLFAVRQVIQPLQTLEKQAARLAWGDYRAIERPVGGIAEIRHLQGELVHMAGKVQAAQQSLHDYIGAITAGQEEERLRLARDLHDDTLQSLIALMQRVQLARLTSGDGTNVALAELEELTGGTIENLRRVTRSLRPIYLEDLGLATALEMLARETGASAGFPVDFILEGEERRLPQASELTLYRIVQEALSNAARHSQATQVKVSIRFSLPEVIVEISDNGKGFVVPRSPAEFAPGGHYGLLGIQERAELIGAGLEILSGPGQGTMVRVRLQA